MASVYDVADFFIDVANKNKDDQITNLKLNKLIYYSQGAYLARTGKPLFEEDIQAWDFGPVAPAIYRTYKNYGSNNINSVSKGYSTDRFTADEFEVLLDVMVEKGQYTGSTLIHMTHNESPWKNVYKEGKKDILISQDSMLAYFSEHPIKKYQILPESKVVEALPRELYHPEDDVLWEELNNEI